MSRLHVWFRRVDCRSIRKNALDSVVEVAERFLQVNEVMNSTTTAAQANQDDEEDPDSLADFLHDDSYAPDTLHQFETQSLAIDGKI